MISPCLTLLLMPLILSPLSPSTSQTLTHFRFYKTTMMPISAPLFLLTLLRVVKEKRGAFLRLGVVTITAPLFLFTCPRVVKWKRGAALR